MDTKVEEKGSGRERKGHTSVKEWGGLFQICTEHKRENRKR